MSKPLDNLTDRGDVPIFPSGSCGSRDRDPGRKKDIGPKIAFLSQPRDGLTVSGSQHGSVAIVLVELARILARQFQTCAVTPTLHGQVPGLVTSSDGLPIHRVDAGSRHLEKILELLDPRPMPRSLRSGYYRRYFEQAAAALASAKPDLIHVMTWAQAAPMLTKALPDVPLVLHLHDDLLARMSPSEATERIAPFSAVVTCSDWLAQVMKRHVPMHAARISAIGNGVDPTRFAPATPRRIPGGPPRLLMVGRISPEKGPHVLIDAFVRIAPSHPSLVLDLVGPVGFLPAGQAKLMGRNVPAMTTAVTRLYGNGWRALWRQIFKPHVQLQDRLLAAVPKSLRNRIRFRGKQAHGDLAEIYRQADVLIQPSVWHEAFGLPVAEAMASGLPVIASASGGLQDLVAHGASGLLVPPGDSDALAGAISDLVEDPARALAYGVAGRQQAMTALTWTVATQKLANVYRGVLSRRRMLAYLAWSAPMAAVM